MAFGYGEHACPGRFFASNEIKIALIHLLLKYDWKGIGSRDQDFMRFEASVISSSTVKVSIRRRKEEVDIDLKDGAELSEA